MSDTLESLEIEIKHNASGAATELNNLANAFGLLKSNMKNAPDMLSSVAKNLKSVADIFKEDKSGLSRIKKMTSVFQGLALGAESLSVYGEKASTFISSLSGLAEATKVKTTGMLNVSKGIDAIGKAAQTLTPESLTNLDKMVTSLAKLQGVDLTGLGRAMSAVGRAGSAKKKEEPLPLPIDTQKAIEAATEIDLLRMKLESLRAAMVNAFNAGDEDKARRYREQILRTEKALLKAEDAARKAAKGIAETGKESTKAAGPLGKFIASIKRVAFYRLLRTILKEITQAFKEGLENAYEYSKVTGGELAKSLDRVASASLKMKNQLGAALGHLLELLEPIILKIIEFVTKLGEALSWVFATLGGKDTYLVANDVAASWKEADKAAQGYKNTILGFDVINRLNDPSSGGGGEDKDYLSMFHEEPIENKPNSVGWLPPLIAGIGGGIAGFQKLKEKFQEFLESLGAEAKVEVDTEEADEKLSKIKSALDAILLLNPIAIAVEIALKFFKPQFEEAFNFIKQGLAEVSKAFNAVTEQMEADSQTQADAVGSASREILESHHLLADGAKGAVGTMVDLNDQWAGSSADTGIKVSESYDNAGRHITTFPETQANAVARMVSLNEEMVATHDSSMSSVLETLDKGVRAFGQFSASTTEAVRNSMSHSANYMVEFSDVTGQITGQFATNSGEAFAQWGTAVGNEVADTLDNAHENIRTFSSIHGIEVQNFVAKRKAIRNAAIGAAAVAVAAGATKLAASAFKKGGGPMGATYADLKGYASGGYPSTGELYIAREAGPELVGTIGNKTAVANNDQIVEAVSNGVYRAVRSAMTETKNQIHVYLDSREIKNGQNRYARAMGV